jgi:hypothetical protein
LYCHEVAMLELRTSLSKRVRHVLVHKYAYVPGRCSAGEECSTCWLVWGDRQHQIPVSVTHLMLVDYLCHQIDILPLLLATLLAIDRGRPLRSCRSAHSFHAHETYRLRLTEDRYKSHRSRHSHAKSDGPIDAWSFMPRSRLLSWRHRFPGQGYSTARLL